MLVGYVRRQDFCCPQCFPQYQGWNPGPCTWQANDLLLNSSPGITLSKMKVVGIYLQTTPEQKDRSELEFPYQLRKEEF